MNVALEASDGGYTGAFRIPFLVLPVASTTFRANPHRWRLLAGLPFVQVASITIVGLQAIFSGSIRLATKSTGRLRHICLETQNVPLPSPKRLVDIERITCERPTPTVETIVARTLETLERKGWQPLKHAPGFLTRIRKALPDERDIACQSHLCELKVPSIPQPHSNQTRYRSNFASKAFRHLPDNMKA